MEIHDEAASEMYIVLNKDRETFYCSVKKKKKKETFHWSAHKAESLLVMLSAHIAVIDKCKFNMRQERESAELSCEWFATWVL